MKKMIISIVCGVVFVTNAMSQRADDALRFSQYYAGGTARSVSMSGAFGALGGDLSVLSTNPAGLAVYRGSEFTFTPALNFVSTNATFDHATYNEKYTRFIINNVGYVYTKNFYNATGLQSLNIGIAYNRLSDFNSEAYLRSSRAQSSMLDEFVWNANHGNSAGGPLAPESLDPFYEGLAYDTHGIFYDKDFPSAPYASDYDVAGNTYGQPMRRTMYTKGGIGEYDLSLGLNFNHKLFFGATLGIQDIYYEESFFHDETPEFADMEYFSFSQEYSSNGWGLNFKAGIIYRPVQMLRLGAAVHTPTYLWIKPYLLTGMETAFGPTSTEKGDFLETENDPSSERYQLKTPWRYNISAAAVFGNFAMADIDVEIVDYSSCTILPKADYDIYNDDVNASFKTAVNVKGGAEFRLGPMYLRGGMAYYGSPFKDGLAIFDSEVKNKPTFSYSGGIGFRAHTFYVDAAYSYTKYPKYYYDLYYPNDIDVVSSIMQKTSNKVVLTFGFRF